MNYTITKNPDYNSVEVSFNGKPSEEVRDALKALRFRWHGQRRVWYGYATEEAVRAAIDGKKPEAAQSAEKPTKATKKATTGTAQDHVRIYWNGIKIDGGKLIRCFYSINNNAQISGDCVSISARDYSDLPRDLLPVTNDSDIYTDYFDNDRATITPEHPLYKYFLFAAQKARARDAKKHAEYCRENLSKPERWIGQHEMYKNDLANDEKQIAEYDALRDPGQPAAEDLAEIDRQRQEAENARRAAEHAEDLRQREIYLIQRADGRRLIEAEAEAHPVSEDAPAVLINWSEHPAFDAYADDKLTLSVAAAENILRKLDETQHNTRETENGRGWYYKTKFTITGKDESGEAFTYTGRYDLGDGDGGLIQHIRAFGEYYLTHDQFGHKLTEPEESNGAIELADYLERFTA